MTAGAAKKAPHERASVDPAIPSAAHDKPRESFTSFVGANRESDLDVARRALGNADAGILQSLLNEAFVDPEGREPHPIAPEDEDEAAAPAAMPVKARREHKWLGRILRSLIALAVLVFAVWIPTANLFQVASAEAVVNANVITLRTPIDGRVATNVPPIGGTIESGETLFTIMDERVDLTRLNDAVRAVADSIVSAHFWSRASPACEPKNRHSSNSWRTFDRRVSPSLPRGWRARG